MPESVQRGVYRARTLTAEGMPYLVAVASDRREIQRATVYPWDCERQITLLLYRRLDSVDPIHPVHR